MNTQQQRYCERCFNLFNLKRILIGGDDGWCVRCGSQHYLPREETREDRRSRRARVTLYEFDYNEDDHDYDLSEEETDDAPFEESDYYEYPPYPDDEDDED